MSQQELSRILLSYRKNTCTHTMCFLVKAMEGAKVREVALSNGETALLNGGRVDFVLRSSPYMWMGA